jgi:hypothetical protein
MIRRTPLKRSKKAIRRVSKKRGKALREYSRLRAKFLFEHPTCQVGCCEVPSRDVHHKASRGKNLNNVATWMAVCRVHHDLIHRCPGHARSLGYLI